MDVAAAGIKYLQSCTKGNLEMVTVIDTINAQRKYLLPHVIKNQISLGQSQE